jgi:hypothetical protein
MNERANARSASCADGLTSALQADGDGEPRIFRPLLPNAEDPQGMGV